MHRVSCLLHTCQQLLVFRLHIIPPSTPSKEFGISSPGDPPVGLEIAQYVYAAPWMKNELAGLFVLLK